MTTTPFEPDPDFGRPQVAAADPGLGAPEQAPGFGVEGEEPDVAEGEAADDDDER